MFLEVKTVWQWRRAAGREFQMTGAATAKARFASSVRVRGKTRCGAAEERTWSDLDLQQVGEVRRVRSLQRLVGDERYLVLDALSDRQPVKWAEKWPCVRSTTTLTDHSCQIILRPLKFVNCRHRSSVEKSVAVIEPRCHDAACYRLCHIIRQEFTDVTKRADVVVARTDDWIKKKTVTGQTKSNRTYQTLQKPAFRRQKRNNTLL